jgi:hypothetical protein
LTARTLAGWVRPVAEQLDADRRRAIEFARGAAPEFWALTSTVDGWTNKDLLAHLAGGNDQMLQTILRAVTARVALDPKALDPDTDAENARRVAERIAWSIDALIAELERDGDEMQTLLARLTDDDESHHPAGATWTLGQLFEIVRRERHDIEHLVQMSGVTPDVLTPDAS